MWYEYNTAVVLSRDQCNSFYIYERMEIMSRVSAHVGQNRDVCLSAHGHLPGTLRQERHQSNLNTKVLITLNMVHLRARQGGGNYLEWSLSCDKNN